MPTIIAMTNPSFAGDSKSVEAIARIISPTYKTIPDNAANALEQLQIYLDTKEDNVLIISGTHGLDFLRLALNNDKVKALIQQKRLMICWSGHQAPPNLTEYSNDIDVVALSQDYITLNPAITASFGSRLVPLQMIPNTLSKERLENGTPIIAAWNTKHQNNTSLQLPTTIPEGLTGYIVAVVGGDAPDMQGKHQLYNRQQAFKDGYTLAREAIRLGKMLLVTTSPRTGKIFKESADSTSPVLMRFTKSDTERLRWVRWEELTNQEKDDPKNYPPHQDLIAHAPNAPLDPISARFLDGIRHAKLATDQYKFIDFRFGDSAYEAMACVAYPYAAHSIVYYSGESMSQAELGEFFPHTYVFRITSMSKLHEAFLERMAKLHRVGIVELVADKINVEHEIDPAKKEQNMHITAATDSADVAAAIQGKLAIFAEVRAVGAGKVLLMRQTTPELPALDTRAPALTDAGSSVQTSPGLSPGLSSPG